MRVIQKLWISVSVLFVVDWLVTVIGIRLNLIQEGNPIVNFLTLPVAFAIFTPIIIFAYWFLGKASEVMGNSYRRAMSIALLAAISLRIYVVGRGSFILFIDGHLLR